MYTYYIHTGSNTLLYAHGEKPYPEMHDSADAVTVEWLKDVSNVAIGGACYICMCVAIVGACCILYNI